MTNIYNPNWYTTNTDATQSIVVKYDSWQELVDLVHKTNGRHSPNDVVVLPKPQFGYHYELVEDTPNAT
jgi:hypothetical protein